MKPIELDLRDRQRGRTTDLLAWARDHSTESRVIVSATLDRSHRLQREAITTKDPDLESWQFISWEEYHYPGRGLMWGVRRRGLPVVYAIDDLDMILANYLLPPGDGTLVRVTMATSMFELYQPEESA